MTKKKSNEILLVGSLNKKYRNNMLVFDPEGIAPTLTAAMGRGGGFVPLIIEYEYGEKNRIENSKQC